MKHYYSHCPDNPDSPSGPISWVTKEIECPSCFQRRVLHWECWYRDDPGSVIKWLTRNL